MSEQEKKQPMENEAKNAARPDNAALLCRILAAAALRRIGIDVPCVVESWE